MARLPSIAATAALGVLFAAPAPLAAQPHEMLGTRALGMAGAFTAVADDASAVYWNPAGQVTGAYVSLVVDHNAHESGGEDDDPGAAALRGSGTLVAFSVPVIGLAYYRVDQSWLGPVREVAGHVAGPERTREGGSLLTDHFAVTLAQTLAEGVHVGVALKAVRGAGVDGAFVGAAGVAPVSAAGGLEILSESRGPADTTFDADLGVMIDLRRWRVGFSGRNLLAPEFPTPVPDRRMTLERTARLGFAALPSDRLTVAVDADLTTGERSDGRWRSLAAGAEWWSGARRLAMRGGLRVQTVDGARPVGTVGASALVWKLLHADAHAAVGADGRREWSVGGRVAF